MRIKTVYLPGDEQPAVAKPAPETVSAPVRAGSKQQRIEFDPRPLTRITGKLCADCTQEWLSWLDYRIHQPLLGPTNTEFLLRESRRLRWEDWRRTIVTQQNLITTACVRDHRVAS